MGGPQPIGPQPPPAPPPGPPPPGGPGGPQGPQGFGDTISDDPLPDSFFNTFNTSFIDPSRIPIAQYLDALFEVREQFKDQLSVNREVDREFEERFVTSVLGELNAANDLRVFLEGLYALGLDISARVNEGVNELLTHITNQLLDSTVDQTQAALLNLRISSLNSARASLQADIDDGPPISIITIALYNAAVALYNSQKDDFIAYATQRNTEITAANAAFDDWNNGVDALNEDIDTYNDGVSGLTGSGITPFPSVQPISPSNINLLPTNFPEIPAYDTMNPPTQLPPDVDAIDLGQISGGVSGPSLFSFDFNPIDFLFDFVSLIPITISYALQTFQFLSAQEEFNPDDDLISLRFLLVPDAIVAQRDPTLLRVSNEIGDTIPLSIDVLETNPRTAEQIISKQLLLSTIEGRGFEITPNELDRLVLLVTSILGFNIQQAIPISVTQIDSEQLSQEGSDPANNLLFALSLNNRLIERIQAGGIDELVNEFIQTAPSLEKLTDKQKDELGAELTGVLTLSLLLTTAGLLGRALGFKNLVPQLISNSNVVSPTVSQQLLTNNQKEEVISEAKENNLRASFGEPGTDRADLLGDAAVNTANRGFINPYALPITSSSIQPDAVKESISAGLVFKGEDPAKARKIAEAVVGQVLTPNASFSTVEDFRSALTGQLHTQGVNASTAKQVAGQAFVAGNLPSSLGDKPLSTDDLRTAVQSRAEEILSPTVGKERATELANEIVDSVIGKEEDNPNTIAAITREKVDTKRMEDDKEYGESHVQLFEDKSSLTRERDVFDNHVLDPANLYKLMFSGSFYGGIKPKTWDRPLDIVA